MNSHNNQPRTVNGNMLTDLKSRVAIVAAVGAVAFTGAEMAQASPVAPNAETAISDILPQVAANTRAFPQEYNTEVTTPAKAIETLKSGVGEDQITKVSVKQTSDKLSVDLSQQDKMFPVTLGGVYTEKRFEGYGGVKDHTEKSYTKVFPYLLSPDLISKNTVKVQAVTKAAGKGKWKAVSKATTMPQYDNYSSIALDTTPAQNGTSDMSAQTSANGYVMGNSGNSYLKTHRNKAQVKLNRPITSAQRRSNGVYLKVTQRWSPTSPAYGKQDQGTKTSYYGPYTKAKQSKTGQVDGSFKSGSK